MSPLVLTVMNNGFLAIIAISSLVGMILTYIANRTAAQTRDDLQKQGQILTKLEINTNSITDALMLKTAEAATATGRAEGIATERANPQISKSKSAEPIAVVVVPDKPIPVVVKTPPTKK